MSADLWPEHQAVRRGAGLHLHCLWQARSRNPAEVFARPRRRRLVPHPSSCVGVEPYDAEGLVARFINGDKSHRARVIELRQSGDELG